VSRPGPEEAADCAGARSRERGDLTSLEALIARIREVRAAVPATRSALVAVTGIDGCGKGHVTRQIVVALEGSGARVAGINIDGWLNLPRVRFSDTNPAEHFYLHAIRFDHLFAELVLPLRDHRSVRIEADHTEETATEYRRERYEFDDVDVIVLEGVYLLKRALASHYDVSCWIECTFDTALERAIARGQERLSREATIRAYRTIYFPAQEIHFERDDPRAAATVRIANDPRLG
jgi:uridine kinase